MSPEESGSEGAVTRDPADCPNCYGDGRETDCLHLLAGDDCPNCETELEKPPAGKVECPNCRYVVNGQRNGVVGDFSLTEREARRLLRLFGYDGHGTLGSLESRIQEVCDEHDTDPSEFRDVMKDLTGRYTHSPTANADPEIRTDGGQRYDG